MAILKTIKAPTKKGPIEVQGRVCLLYVGNYQHKFFMQETPHGEILLLHYRSGLKLGSLTPIKLQQHRSYERLTNRGAAELLIEDLIAKHGADRVNVKLNSAPDLN